MKAHRASLQHPHLRAIGPAADRRPARALPEEFDHHPRFKELIARGAIVLVARGADSEVYADGIARRGEAADRAPAV